MLVLKTKSKNRTESVTGIKYILSPRQKLRSHYISHKASLLVQRLNDIQDVLIKIYNMCARHNL